MTKSLDATPERKRSVWPDVLRGMAIFGVLTTHVIQRSDLLTIELTSGNSSMSKELSSYLGLGRYGVEVFFFLSGWLLMLLYGRDTTRKLSFSKYFLRRVARIWPLWMIFLVYSIIVDHFLDKGNWHYSRITPIGGSELVHSTPVIILLTATFTLFISQSLWINVMPGGWSILAEVGHYLLFPFVKSLTNRKLIRFLFINFLFFGVLNILREKYQIEPVILREVINSLYRLNLMSTLLYFILGMLTQSLYLEYKNGRFENMNLQMNKMAFVEIGFVLILIPLTPLNFGDNLQALGYLMLTLLLSFAALNLRFIKNVLVKVGKYSYFIYFCHFQALNLLQNFLHRRDGSLRFQIPEFLLNQISIFLILFVFVLGISYTLATISYRLIEKPIINAAHRF